MRSQVNFFCFPCFCITPSYSPLKPIVNPSASPVDFRFTIISIRLLHFLTELEVVALLTKVSKNFVFVVKNFYFQNFFFWFTIFILEVGRRFLNNLSSYFKLIHCIYSFSNFLRLSEDGAECANGYNLVVDVFITNKAYLHSTEVKKDYSTKQIFLLKQFYLQDKHCLKLISI